MKHKYSSKLPFPLSGTGTRRVRGRYVPKPYIGKWVHGVAMVTTGPKYGDVLKGLETSHMPYGISAKENNIL